MGIVNATPDSFSDAGLHRDARRPRGAGRGAARGWRRPDRHRGRVGGDDEPPVEAEEEIARVVPLIERVAGELGALVSVDTYKPAVARAAIAAGAAIVNDVSGLRDPELADVCAQTGAGLVLMHTRATPKEKLLDPSLDGRVVADVEAFLRERIALALERGVASSSCCSTPAPTSARRRRRRSRCCGRCRAARARAAAAAGGLAQGLHRRDHARPPRDRLAGHAGGDRLRGGRRAADPAGPRRGRGGRLPGRACCPGRSGRGRVRAEAGGGSAPGSRSWGRSPMPLD